MRKMALIFAIVNLLLLIPYMMGYLEYDKFSIFVDNLFVSAYFYNIYKGNI